MTAPRGPSHGQQPARGGAAGKRRDPYPKTAPHKLQRRRPKAESVAASEALPLAVPAASPAALAVPQQPAPPAPRPAPVVNLVIPSEGPISGGVEVTVLGSDFTCMPGGRRRRWSAAPVRWLLTLRWGPEFHGGRRRHSGPDGLLWRSRSAADALLELVDACLRPAAGRDGRPGGCDGPVRVRAHGGHHQRGAAVARRRQSQRRRHGGPARPNRPARGLCLQGRYGTCAPSGKDGPTLTASARRGTATARV